MDEIQGFEHDVGGHSQSVGIDQRRCCTPGPVTVLMGDRLAMYLVSEVDSAFCPPWDDKNEHHLSHPHIGDRRHKIWGIECDFGNWILRGSRDQIEKSGENHDVVRGRKVCRNTMHVSLE